MKMETKTKSTYQKAYDLQLVEFNITWKENVQSSLKKLFIPMRPECDTRLV